MLARRDSSSYTVAFLLRAFTLVLFGGFLTACGAPAPAISQPTPVALETAAQVTIVIKNFGYSPTNLTVSPGETIAVRNDDLAIHTLTADNRSFNTGNISRGITMTFTAPTQRGTYPFHCLFHNYMTGSLTVS